MGVADNLTEIEKQLLMAAFVGGLVSETTLERANSASVVDRVLKWRGLTSSQIESGWRMQDCDPEHAKVFYSLTQMVQQFMLFEGGGNWGAQGDPDRPAAWPQYTSCRLTTEGERLANELLDQYPEYRETN